MTRPPTEAAYSLSFSFGWACSCCCATGDVEAPSREAAEAAAVWTFNLNPEQRNRLVVQELG